MRYTNYLFFFFKFQRANFRKIFLMTKFQTEKV